MAGEDRENRDFEEGLERLARRRTIERLGWQGQTGSELRRKARGTEAGLDVSGLVNRLIEEEFVIDEKRAAVAADLSTELHKRFKLKGLAVVLFGSSVTGGVKTREVMGVPDREPDFDWGVVFDRSDVIPDGDSEELRIKIRDFGNKQLSKLSAKYGIYPPIKGCPVKNPTKEWSWNYRNADEARLDMLNIKHFSLSDRIPLFFYPSFPREINEHNRSVILEALAKIATYDIRTWKMLSESFLVVWEFLYKLKDKHLLDLHQLPKSRDALLAERVAGVSGTVMSKRMRDLILATGVV